MLCRYFHPTCTFLRRRWFVVKRHGYRGACLLPASSSVFRFCRGSCFPRPPPTPPISCSAVVLGHALCVPRPVVPSIPQQVRTSALNIVLHVLSVQDPGVTAFLALEENHRGFFHQLSRLMQDAYSQILCRVRRGEGRRRPCNTTRGGEARRGRGGWVGVGVLRFFIPLVVRWTRGCKSSACFPVRPTLSAWRPKVFSPLVLQARA